MKKIIALFVITLLAFNSYAGHYYSELYVDTSHTDSNTDYLYVDEQVTFSLVTAAYPGTINYSIIEINGQDYYDYVGLRSSNDSWGEYNTSTPTLQSDTYRIDKSVGGGYATVTANW